MPAVATKPAAKADKPAPEDFLSRLERFNKADIAAALVGYRGLVTALADDPKHEADEAHVIEILDALKIGQADLRRDIETLLTVRASEAQLLTADQHAALEAEAKAATDKVKELQAAIPLLRGRATSIGRQFAANGQAMGEVNRHKASCHRLWGDPADVERRIEAGQLTGPSGKAVGQFYRGVPVIGPA